jgi:Iap family predicted aminopeptidase
MQENLTMMIKDLEVSKDLASEELSAVRGGANTIVQGGQYAPVAVQGGGFFSPQVVTSVPVNAPVAVLTDNDLKLDLETNVATVAQSLGTLVRQ